jgi:N-acetylmuramoyl-L-alanine amidase
MNTYEEVIKLLIRRQGKYWFVIGIDPGHGGFDSGAIGRDTGLKEAHVNLAIALAVKKWIEKRTDKVLIIMTRTADKAPSGTTSTESDLLTRASMLNNTQCDIAVSIHTNAHANRSANYFAAFVYGLGGEGEKLAQAIIKTVTQATNWPWGADDDGVHEKNLYMVRKTKMPATLLECGFISNPEQERLLADPEFQDMLGKAIADGILNYLGIEEVEKEVPTEQWQEKLMTKAGNVGIVTLGAHKAREVPEKWFVVAVVLNAMLQVVKAILSPTFAKELLKKLEE